jgi:hypothetical protein
MVFHLEIGEQFFRKKPYLLSGPSMGFGSYDESEQDKQDYETDFDDEDGVATAESEHQGEVEYEFTASNDELLDKLKDIKNT